MVKKHFKLLALLLSVIPFHQLSLADNIDYSSQCKALNDAATTSKQNLLSKVSGCWVSINSIQGLNVNSKVFLVLNPKNNSNPSNYSQICVALAGYIEYSSNNSIPYFDNSGKLKTDALVYTPTKDLTHPETLLLKSKYVTINSNKNIPIYAGTSLGDITFVRDTGQSTGLGGKKDYMINTFLNNGRNTFCSFDPSIFNNL